MTASHAAQHLQESPPSSLSDFTYWWNKKGRGQEVQYYSKPRITPGFFSVKNRLYEGGLFFGRIYCFSGHIVPVEQVFTLRNSC